MNRLPIFLFWLLVVLFVSYVLSSSMTLPERVATHFGSGGVPNGWMSRDDYVQFTLMFGLGVSLFVVGSHYLLARFFGNQFNIPNREYWLTPERRADTLGFIVRHSWWLGCLMLLFMMAIYHLVLMSNRSSSPRLLTIPFLLLMGGFLIGLGSWVAALRARFRRPKRRTEGQ